MYMISLGPNGYQEDEMTPLAKLKESSVGMRDLVRKAN
jgi:hypothetical protein